MKIGLINIEPNIINVAYMKISQYHKSKGDVVEWYSALFYFEYDIIYCSSLFTFTDKSQVPKNAICGGTGFDITSKLPEQIEKCDYDYSIYPKCKKSYVWFSQGCIRNCDFCVVRKKEGLIHSVKPKNLNPNGTEVVVQDNNFFADNNWREHIKQLQEWNQPVEFLGIDVRLITKEQCDALKTLKHKKQFKIAWDNPKDEITLQKIKELITYIRPYKIMCYVLIGYNSTQEEDLYRVEILRSLKIDPFVMPYNKKDDYQRKFARWVNMKACFKSCSWQEYKK